MLALPVLSHIGDQEEDPTVAGGSCAAAGRRDILMMFIRETALTIGSGIALGLLFAAASGRILSGLHYEVGPPDPFAFTTTPLVLTATALIATWLLAHRATSIAPTVALRTE
jgi:ABC-type antimicrobial peptide transport system permease subunit